MSVTMIISKKNSGDLSTEPKQKNNVFLNTMMNQSQDQIQMVKEKTGSSIIDISIDSTKYNPSTTRNKPFPLQTMGLVSNKVKSRNSLYNPISLTLPKIESQILKEKFNFKGDILRKKKPLS